MVTLIKNGRVLDPETKLDAVMDVLVVDNYITKIEENIADEAVKNALNENGYTEESLSVIDATGCYVMPGLIDLHVHLREPGQEHKETIRTGARAAARGGFTTICAMPNTNPVVDCVEVLDEVNDKIKAETYVNVLQLAAMTAGEDGEFITDFEALKKHGAPAVSEDGKSVMNGRVARQAFREAALNNLPVFDHCEDIDLRARGVMNAGSKAKEYGLYGILNAVEDTITARDMILAKDTGAHIHLCHISTAGVVQLIRFGKSAGVRVTAEVTPHHFTLTEDDVDPNNANYKMNPPLRSKKDVEAILEGLADGTIDAIATDHAPHSRSEKKLDFAKAPFGITGLETAVSITISELVNKRILTPLQMAEKMSYNPAKILGINKGRLQVASPADIVIIDPEAEYVVDSSKFLSKGKNTPFEGRKVNGVVRATIAGGKVIYKNIDGNESVIDKEERDF